MTSSSLPEQSRVVHGSDGPAGRVGSGRVTILPDFGGSGRVGSTLRIFKFFTDYFLVPESIFFLFKHIYLITHKK